MATSVVYWRGANGGSGWVTENNNWMEELRDVPLNIEISAQSN